MRSKLMLGLGLLLAACATAAAQGYKPVVEIRNREALRGLDAVRVLVEVTPYAEQQGVTAAQLEAGAAERLGKAGLRVLTGEGAGDAKGQPVFFIRLILFDTGRGLYGYTTDVQLRETVTRIRAPAAELTAATWQNCALGMKGPPEPKGVLEGALSVVDFFVREYRAANGR